MQINYDAVYSAMTEVTGGLIALFGVFIVYKLQIQRDRIKGARETLKNIFLASEFYVPLSEILEFAEQKIRELKFAPGEEKQAKVFHTNLKRYVRTYQFTVRHGAAGTGMATILFLYYICVLHLNEYLPDPALFFWIGFAASLLIVSYLGWFIVQCLAKEGREYDVKKKFTEL